MRMENSPEYEARMATHRKKRSAEAAHAEAEWKKARAAWIAAGRTWTPMEECPFGALDNRYRLEGAIVVTDRKQTALATVKGRFGTPVFWKKVPEQVYRDGMMCLVGGEQDPRPDLPKWWWKWELTDVFGHMTYASGHETGLEEIDFVPTLWTFLPDPPSGE